MPTAYAYKKTDAFTASASLGNPAACLYLSEGQQLSAQQMLQIAQQHKGFVSEVVYCAHQEGGIFLTYYSSECEVDFCGHGTIACLYGLIRDTPALLHQNEICIHTNRKGALTVYNRIAQQDTVLITAPEPVYVGTPLDSGSIAGSLGVAESIIDTAYPVDLIDAGLRTLIVPVCSLADEIAAAPQLPQLKDFCTQNKIDIVLIFSRETQHPASHAHTRVFAPLFGYLEDPATGSGNSAFGYYMLKNGLWDGGDCVVEQGGGDRVFNSIHLSTTGQRVLFGGSATVRIDGTYYA